MNLILMNFHYMCNLFYLYSVLFHLIGSYNMVFGRHGKRKSCFHYIYAILGTRCRCASRLFTLAESLYPSDVQAKSHRTPTEAQAVGKWGVEPLP